MRINQYARALAKQAIEDRLRANEFIDGNLNYIYSNLMQADRTIYELERTAALANAGEPFIQECRPIIDGILNMGSSLQNFRATALWLRRLLPGRDPRSIVSLLTLIYLIEKGFQDVKSKGPADWPDPEDSAATNGATKRNGSKLSRIEDTWSRIDLRLADLLADFPELSSDVAESP